MNDGRLPDFIIIGAPKAGTTSLHFYLSLHPEIFMPSLKEPNFFTAHPGSTWPRGVGWYRTLFHSDRTITGEASAGYAWKERNPHSAERMYQVVPHCKLIYCVRQPWERLVSHFLMSRRRGEFAGSFREFLDDPHFGGARYASYYGRQLREFLAHFPLQQVLIVETSELDRKRSETLEKIFSFLGVAPDFRSILFRHKRYVGHHGPVPSRLGRRVAHSRLMRCIENCLSPQLAYHVRNALLLPFSERRPSLDLPDPVRLELFNDLQREVNDLRALTGLLLPSLSP